MRLLAFIAWVLLCSSCSVPKKEASGPLVRTYVDPDFRTYRMQRVVMLPFDQPDHATESAATLETSFRDALQRRVGLEVVLAEPSILEEVGLDSPYELGKFSLALLAQLASVYHADGVLFGAVTSWRPYEPLVVGASVELVVVTTGMTVWDADSLIDTAEGQVVRAVERDMEVRGSGMVDEWAIALRSPRHISRYLADLCCRELVAYHPRFGPKPFR